VVESEVEGGPATTTVLAAVVVPGEDAVPIGDPVLPSPDVDVLGQPNDGGNLEDIAGGTKDIARIDLERFRDSAPDEGHGFGGGDQAERFIGRVEEQDLSRKNHRCKLPCD
jgi:hypothetical protein